VNFAIGSTHSISGQAVPPKTRRSDSGALWFLSGGDDLLVVMMHLVPAGEGHDGEDGDIQEHGQGGSVARCGLPAHCPDSAAQGAGVLVIGFDPGAGGAFEGNSGPAQLRTDLLGREERQGVKCFAEGGEVGLGGRVVALVEDVGDAFGGGGGLVPGIGSATVLLAAGVGGSGLGGGEAFADLGEGQVGGECGAREPDRLTRRVGVADQGDLVAAYVAGREVLHLHQDAFGVG
jgi:hypothetical protein